MSASRHPPAIFLMGPTASGKTALAVSLVERFPLEIISVDSALVYRGMDIGTAKPDAATLARAPHHLLDIRDPTEAYSAAAFCDDARRLMADIAARLAPNDSQRIGRALEIFRLTGSPMSSLLDRAEAELPYRVLQIALIPSERAVLHQRIATRFDAMLAEGLIDEVEALRRSHALKPDLPSMRAVGYRQAWAYLDGDIYLAALREQGLAATRQLAKRQLTWLRSWPDAVVLDCLAEDLQAQAFALIERHLKP